MNKDIIEDERALHVFAFANHKGGAGKTMLTKIFASCLSSAGYRVVLIDADPKPDLARWADRAKKNKYWAENTDIFVSADVQEISDRIDDIYDNKSADFVLLDTPGWGDTNAEKLALLADSLVIPVKPSETDVAATLDMKLWYDELPQRISDPDLIPNLHVVLTDVQVETKRGVAEKRAVARAKSELSAINTIILNRAAYKTMDEEGMLYEVSVSRDQSDLQGVRITAKSAYNALMLGTKAINEILGGGADAAS